MNYNIILTETFKKEAKKLIKKYASLPKEIAELGKLLEKNPTFGIPLGNDIYKIRIAIASKNKGKSGGARIITCVKIIEKNIYLITIFNKGDKDSISDNEISTFLNKEGL